MDNVQYLEQMKLSYESLRFFDIKNNYLILNYNGKLLFRPITSINLSGINENIFLLNPVDIIDIIFLLELLSRNELSSNEIDFIKSYVNKYLDINQKALENTEIDQNLLYCLSIPIYTSYEPSFIEKPAAQTIDSLIIEHSKHTENQNGRDNVQRLVLTNPNFKGEDIQEDGLNTLEKAGFTTILLIVGAVIATCIYIAFFVINH